MDANMKVVIFHTHMQDQWAAHDRYAGGNVGVK